MFIYLSEFTHHHTTPNTFTVVYFSQSVGSWHLRSICYTYSLDLPEIDLTIRGPYNTPHKNISLLFMNIVKQKTCISVSKLRQRSINPVIAILGLCKDILGPCKDHFWDQVMTVLRPFNNNWGTIWGPCKDYFGTKLWPFCNHLITIEGPFGDHVRFILGPCYKDHLETM